MADEPLTPERIEELLDGMVEDTLVRPDHRDTAKLLLYAIMVGTNPDKIAKASGLNRDVVRAKAATLRENRVFVTEAFKKPGVIAYSAKDDQEANVEFLLWVLCAEGLVRQVFDEPGNQDAPTASL